MLIDSHCHLDRLHISADDALSDARARGVTGVMCIGVNAEELQSVVAIAERHDDVWASVGIHPLSVTVESTIDPVRQFMDHAKVVAIGETGLDLYWDYAPIGETGLDYHYETEESALTAQRRLFAEHLELAGVLGKPTVIHTRAAQKDTINLIKAHGNPSSAGVLHCFTESWEMAKQALDLGYYISISGIVTFRNADSLRDVAKKVPADRLLIETDAPWLTPVPNRGKPNLPGYVRDVAEFVADLRGVNFDEFAAMTSSNFLHFAGINR